MVVETRSKAARTSAAKFYTSGALAQIYLVKWLVAFGIGLLHTLLVNLLYRKVEDEYMDEIFHVNQTEAYCRGDWKYWNRMITTPPLIYGIAAVSGFCGRERYLNSAIIPLTFVGLTRLRLAWTNGHNNFKEAILCALSIIALPVLFDTNLLFYTDLLSLTLVIFALGTPTPTLSALIFILSVFSRQTNIIWAAFYCLQHLQQDFDSKRPLYSTILCVLRHWAFGLLGLGFLVFVVRNDFSIVLGDKTAHQLHLHIPQIFYFASFVLFSSPFLFLQNTRIVWRHFKRNIFTYILLGLLMIPCVHYFTYNHLYLLSDNRHFTFYIWRRWFLKGPAFKYLTIPLYVISFAYIYVTLRHLRWPTLVGWFVATCFVVVPAHLVEFRYFILPFALWRLMIQRTKLLTITGELLVHVFVNIITLWLFFERPFVWQNEPDKLQRFMW
ncbi:Dol-P-Glc:Glc(2)Man(9)GlcNAc(2)-PP-Dol alpha-1,2-glucosyltransferase [Aphelenchoides bicaudatus]|nr:Dol-P-Glc:Glc(2)Man(9)GlcNAc(2)-PP-Dol alpha-1,2-glucosyltransferase [Aphelenchoides bicaudatus]